MVMTKEERYARHREYMKTPMAREKQRIAAAKRYADPVQYARIRAQRNTPESKEKQRIANKKHRSRPEYREWKRKYRNSDSAKRARRNQLYKKNFGVTLDEYESLLEKQNGVCAICNQKEVFIYRGSLHSLAIDHDHATGKVRGLLCRHCNQMLGLALDNIATLRNAVSYLNHVH